jgi:hypothetical protein
MSPMAVLRAALAHAGYETHLQKAEFVVILGL